MEPVQIDGLPNHPLIYTQSRKLSRDSAPMLCLLFGPLALWCYSWLGGLLMMAASYYFLSKGWIDLLLFDDYLIDLDYSALAGLVGVHVLCYFWAVQIKKKTA
jgi:hypothetical protein